MEKIKICHVVNIISGKSDGVFAHLKMLFKYVDADKFQHYLVFQGNPFIEEEVKNLGVIVYPLPSLRKKFSINTFIELYWYLKENEISIIHAHLIKSYVLVGVVNFFLRKKAIFNYHGSFIQNDEYYTFLEEFIYSIAHFIVFLCRSFQCVVVPSQASRQVLLAETHFLPPVEVYYNGYSEENNAMINNAQPGFINTENQNKFKIGVVSRFNPEKRVDVAIHIAHQLSMNRNDFHFYILGDGSLEESLKNLVEELQVSHVVTIIGFVPNARKYLNVFDVILLTSDREGMPFIVWEAMAQAVPIISSDVGGVREIIETEQCGRVFERRNVPAAIEILSELLDDNELRRTMGAKGKRAIEMKYNKQTFVRRFEQIYSDVLGSK